MHWLTELRLAAAGRPHTFAFAHRSFQDFFLTRWLLSGHDRPRPEVVLTDQQWREAAVIALQVGSDQLRERLLTTAIKIADEETSRHPALVPDVAEYLALHPWAPLPVLPPIVGTATIWSGRLAHVLKLLAAGLATEPMLVPEPIRASSGRLVMTAFLRGNRSDQKTALELLPLLHTALARWACEWAANVWSQLLVETAVRVSYRDPTLLSSMRVQSRALLVAGVARSPRLFGDLLRARIPGRSDGTLPAIVHDLMLVLRLVAVFITGLAAFYLTKDLVNHLAMDTVLTWFAVAVVPLAFFVLSFWLDPGGISGIQFVSGAVVVAGTVVMAVYGLSIAIASIIALFSDFQSGMLGLILAFILTWPASLIGYLVADPSARRRHWGCPQWFLGRVLVTELRASTPEFSWSSAVGRSFAVVTSLGFLLLLAVVLVLLLAPPPGEREPEGVQSRWAYAVLVILGAVAAVRAGLRKLSVRSRIRRSISNGVVIDDTLLTLLYGADSQSDTKLLLTKLGQLPPAALHSCVVALTDLAHALEHVSRMVPVQKSTWGSSGGNARIPRGVWDVGPQYSHSGFREWLEGYDAKHRGRLRWLASTHRDTVARLLEQAKATPVR
jgi:hypothetical protein